jgi:hypothetical protein
MPTIKVDSTTDTGSLNLFTVETPSSLYTGHQPSLFEIDSLCIKLAKMRQTLDRLIEKNTLLYECMNDETIEIMKQDLIREINEIKLQNNITEDMIIMEIEKEFAYRQESDDELPF